MLFNLLVLVPILVLFFRLLIPFLHFKKFPLYVGGLLTELIDWGGIRFSWRKFLLDDTGALDDFVDGISRCTPKASFIDSAIFLKRMASTSAKESSSTKKHINNDMRSAKVASQGGRPASHLGH